MECSNAAVKRQSVPIWRWRPGLKLVSEHVTGRRESGAASKARKAPVPISAAGPTQDHRPVRLLTPEEVSAYLSIPVNTLYAWRYRSVGPPAIRIGRHLRYPEPDLIAWITTLERVS